MKKVLIIAAVLVVVMGILATAGLLYVGYRVKNHIEQQAAALRPDASRPSPARVAAAAEGTGHRVEACSLLSKEEASQILGVAVERTQAKEASGESTCQYFVKPRSQQQRTASVADAFMKIAKGGATPEPEVKANEAYKVSRQTGMDDLAKGIGGLVAPADAPYLAVRVSWENARQGTSILKGTIAGNSAGVQTTENLPGIGDEAFLGPMDTMLAFVKGETGVQIDLSQVPKGRDKGVAIARTIVPRL